MAQQIINNGESGLVVRGKINDNFTELYQGKDAVTVNTFADLPAAGSHTGERWWVLQSTGVWLVNRKTKGAYYSNGTTWEYLGDFPQSAAEVSFTPTGNIVATDVQAAIAEVETDTALLLNAKANNGGVTGSGLTQNTSRFLGRLTAGFGAIEELTAAALTAALDVFTTSLKGLVPASGGGTTNFLRADGTWAAPAGGGGSFTLPVMPPFKPLAGQYISNSYDNGTNTQVSVAGVMRISPVVFPYEAVVDRLSINVSTLIAASLARIVIYDADANGRPTTLLLESTDLDCGSTGMKDYTPGSAFTFTAGKLYWVGVWPSSTQTLRSVNTAGLPVLGFTVGATPTILTFLTQTKTYTGSAGDWPTYSNTQLAGGSVKAPVVYMRLA